LSGLAHCLLPESPTSTTQIGAKYVNQAIPSLLAMMKISKDDISKIEVVLAGGANMMQQLSRSNPQHIGFQNTETAKSNLIKLGFNIKHEDIGGDLGRQIIIDCNTGYFSVKTFSKSA
jgi:chemotaxis protein CheD